jgi:hypothetical protein
MGGGVPEDKLIGNSSAYSGQRKWELATGIGKYSRVSNEATLSLTCN